MDAGRIPEFNEILELDGFEHDSSDPMDSGTIAYLLGRVKDRLGWKTAADLAHNLAGWIICGYESLGRSVSMSAVMDDARIFPARHADDVSKV